MAKRIIVKYDAPLLRERSKVVTEFDQKLWTLLDDMKETMHAVRGLGLAAVQVGILKRVVLVLDDTKKQIYELVNPEIIKSSGSHVGQEGCLSIPGQNGYVERPRRLIIKAQDRLGQSFLFKINAVLTSAVVCHELDHLDGVLYIDKVVEKNK